MTGRSKLYIIRAMSDFLVICLVSAVVSAIVSKLSHWYLSTEFSKLQFTVSVLEERLLSEIKRRARSVAQKNQDFDAEILAAAKKTPAAPEAPQPWWAQYVGTKVEGH